MAGILSKKNNNHRKGWRGDPDGHARAGQRGGEKTKLLHGETFYSAIGKKGGRISPGNFKNNPQRASMAGRKGGRAPLSDMIE